MIARTHLLAIVAATCASGVVSGCGYFATRPPNPPTHIEVCRTDQTTANLLFTDFKCALEARQSAGLQNYQSILGDGFVFLMDPIDASDLGLSPPVSWDKTADINYTRTMLANADTLQLTWDTLTQTSQASELEQWTALYTIHYVPAGETTQTYQGEAFVELALPAGQAHWQFTRWEDHRVQGDVAALGKLKRR